MKKTLLRKLCSHFALLYVRARSDMADRNQIWLVITVCLMSWAMSLRMAEVAGWIHLPPMVKLPSPGSVLLVQQANLFWDSTTNAKAGSVLLAAASTLVMLARLERWRMPLVVGLVALMAWWYPTAINMCVELGPGVGMVYLAFAFITSVATVKTYRGFILQDESEAEVDNSMRLIGMAVDMNSADPSAFRLK